MASTTQGTNVSRTKPERPVRPQGNPPRDKVVKPFSSVNQLTGRSHHDERVDSLARADSREDEGGRVPARKNPIRRKVEALRQQGNGPNGPEVLPLEQCVPDPPPTQESAEEDSLPPTAEACLLDIRQAAGTDAANNRLWWIMVINVAVLSAIIGMEIHRQYVHLTSITTVFGDYPLPPEDVHGNHWADDDDEDTEQGRWLDSYFKLFLFLARRMSHSVVRTWHLSDDLRVLPLVASVVLPCLLWAWHIISRPSSDPVIILKRASMSYRVHPELLAYLAGIYPYVAPAPQSADEVGRYVREWASKQGKRWPDTVRYDQTQRSMRALAALWLDSRESLDAVGRAHLTTSGWASAYKR